uniref:CCHC-type domain-containing protein n=1 Tax=Salarias fasciatus TaxID=181472 RepID=A0A672HDY1_SALFA
MSRRSDCCYRCGEPGHIARNCPAPAPRARARLPSPRLPSKAAGLYLTCQLESEGCQA